MTTENVHENVRAAVAAFRAGQMGGLGGVTFPAAVVDALLDEYDRARAVADKAITLADGQVEQAVPLSLGYSNPSTGPLDFRLYARDEDEQGSPRWRQPTPRVAEAPLIERGDREGARYLLVKVADR